MAVFNNRPSSGTNNRVLNITLSQNDKREDLKLPELDNSMILSIDTVATDDQLHLVIVYRKYN